MKNNKILISKKSKNPYFSVITVVKNDHHNVALTLKNNKLIHSNSYHMSVVIEDTNQTIERIFKTDGKVIGLRKIIM